MASLLAVLLGIAAAALARATAAQSADAACDAALASVAPTLQGADCAPANSTCPPACADTVAGLLGACAGRHYTDAATSTVRLFDPAATVTGFATIVGGACRDSLVDLVLLSGAHNASCADAINVMGAGARLWCPTSSTERRCPGPCQTAMHAVHSVCSPCETVPVGDSSVMVKTFTAVGAPVVMSTQCQADLSTCAFGLGCTFAEPPLPDNLFLCPGVMADLACDAAIIDASSQALAGTACSGVDGTCPATCTQLFQGVMDACAGKYHTDAQTGNVQLFAPDTITTDFSALLSAPCREAIVSNMEGSTSIPTVTTAVTAVTLGGDISFGRAAAMPALALPCLAFGAGI